MKTFARITLLFTIFSLMTACVPQATATPGVKPSLMPLPTSTPTATPTPTPDPIDSLPLEIQAQVDHVQTLEDGRIVAIEKLSEEDLTAGKTPMLRKWQWDVNQKEWVDYVPQLVGTGGLYTEEYIALHGEWLDVREEIAKIPLMTSEAPENPNYPLFRNPQGDVLSGVLAYDPNVGQIFNSKGEVVIEAQENYYVSGRLAGGFLYGSDEYKSLGLAVDVPLGTGDYYRFFLTCDYYRSPFDDNSGIIPHYFYEDLLQNEQVAAGAVPAQMVWNSIPEQWANAIKFMKHLVKSDETFNSDAIGAPFGLRVALYGQDWVDLTKDVYTGFNSLLKGTPPDASKTKVRFNYEWLFSKEQFGN